MTVNQKTAIKYFQAFSDKDVKALAKLLADNVSLRDWEQSAEGKNAVLAANQAIFDSVGSISVSPLRLFSDAQDLACEIAITIDGGSPLKVVDVLEFDVEGKICAVRAFKG